MEEGDTVPMTPEKASRIDLSRGVAVLRNDTIIIDRGGSAMADIDHTKAAVAAKRVNLHRSSPYDAEITAPDSTGTYACGEEVTPPLEQVDIEVATLPAVPEWADRSPVSIDIDSLTQESPFR